MTGNNSCRLSYIEFEMSIFHFYIPKLFQFLSLSSLLPLISIKQLTQPVISQELFSILLNYLSASVSWMQITLILMLTVLRREKKKKECRQVYIQVTKCSIFMDSFPCTLLNLLFWLHIGMASVTTCRKITIF